MKRIIHYVVIHSPQTEVFDAISTEEGLSNWWTHRVSIKERTVGSVIDFTFLQGFNPDMEITIFNEPIEIHWKCTGGHKPWIENTFSFELEDEGEDTGLKFIQTYANQITEKEYGRYNFNWGYYLQSLKEYCETGTGKPYKL